MQIRQHLGGLIIFICFLIGMIFVSPQTPYIIPIIVGTSIMLFGAMIVPKWIVQVQIVAALAITIGGLNIYYINIFGAVELSYFAMPFTALFIVGIANATNLDERYDQLISILSTLTIGLISIVAYILGYIDVSYMGIFLMIPTLGYLIFNSFSLGRTAILFLGYMIAILLIYLVKIHTLLFLVPILTLGLPCILHHYFLKRKMTDQQSTYICCSIAVLFLIPIFLYHY